ncbi:MAG: TolC family protein [Chitinophagales bacterium]|nr:TolC family protein [Chitinophagales bacterium]
MNIIKICLLFLFPLALSAQGENQFSLNAAIDYAIKNNYDHKNQIVDNLIIYERIKDVITTGLPNINASLSYRNNFYLPTSILPGEIIGQPGTTVPVQFGTPNNLDFNIDVQQLIFDGRYIVGLQARKMMKQVSEQGVKMSEENVRDLIKKSYFAVLMTKESAETLKKNKSVLEKLLNDTKQIYKEGLIEELDVDRLQLSLANLNKEILKLENQLALTTSALKFNMGYSIDKDIVLTDSITSYFGTYYQSAPSNNFDIKNRVEYKLQQDNILLKGYDVKQQKAGYMPSLVAFFNTGTQAQRQRFDFFDTKGQYFYYGSFGFKLMIPIWDGNSRLYKLNQTKLGIEKSKNDFEKFQVGAKVQAFQAQVSFYNAKRDYDNQLEVLALAEKINKKAKIMFKEGIGSSFELANSEGELIKTQINVLQSMYAIIIAKLDYDKAVGNK